MPIPTEVVGSLPRPTCKTKPLSNSDSITHTQETNWENKIKDLQQAYADYDAGKITRDDLLAAQDKAAQDSVRRMEEAGETFVTDGEQRASS